ncbi:hypothetical protein CRG98_035066 [Punica granatum]|uniref:NB-ARC domain-containing protein n=1 Tax=Punica granatum TaxID=22663 RepID=A0A2I0IKJ7_PUNGR|nr:hypothetical protein CRG98_035066 [Punica granatum]
MWKHFELQEVGIPEDCIQLILTTRDRAVCQKMLCQKEIKVEPLPYNDAWTLFVDTLGSNLSPSREPIARCIVKECKGLPLAIVVTAGSMRAVDADYGWKDRLEKLRQPQALQQDMQTGVFPILQHSYSCLDPKKQRCLLLCALYPEDKKIDRKELIEFYIDEGVIHGDDREEMHDEGHQLLDELEKACLLERLGGIIVRMHDVIRDMAICIMSADKSCMVKSGLHLDDVPDDPDEWFPNLQKVSLMYNDIEEVPSSISPNCPRLSTLLLNGCRGLREIPGCFFERIGGLKVINLSDTSITEVPESITNLEKLRALILNQCSELSLLPSLEKLTSLRKLDLRGCSEIKEVPDGLGMLVNLTYLDLLWTGIEKIPDGVIKIESLRINGEQPELIEGQPPPPLKHLVGGLYLTRLKLLDIAYCEEVESIVGAEAVAGESPHAFSQLESINITGCPKMKNVVGPQLLPRLQNLRDILIEGPSDMEEIIVMPSPRPFPTATLTRLEEIESLRINGEQPELIEGQPPPPLKHLVGGLYLTRLKLLDIAYCEEVESIVGAEAVAGESPHAFSQLESINITGCPKMKNVVGPQLLPRLQNLRDILIEGPSDMEEIIVMPSPRPFPTATSALLLTKICVNECDKMKRVLTLELFMLLPNLQKISVSGCEQMKEVIGHELERGGGAMVGNNATSSLLLPSPQPFPAATSALLPFLTEIYVYRCHEMKRVLTLELFMLLPNLEEISVNYCKQMKEVIGHELEHGGGASSLLLPPYASSADQSKARQLTLILHNLEELESICSWTGLRDLIHVIEIRNCPKLKRIEMLDGIFASSPPSLKKIRLQDREWWESLEWNHPEAKTALLPYVSIEYV